MISYLLRLAKNFASIIVEKLKPVFFIFKFSVDENKIMLIDEVTHLKCVRLGHRNFIGTRVSFLSHNNGIISIGDDCKVEKNCILEALKGNIYFGDNSTLNPSSVIRAWGDVKIGNGVRIGPFVQIMAMNHKYHNPNEFIYKQGLCGKGIVIGDNIWIGANAVILDGVTIGNNCIIGASAVVTRNIPSNSIAVGNPAVVKKNLDFTVGMLNANC
ncbi:MAG: acetyltransferase-like isoleucine patch superfamily enzyme [Colwellia sp.]|jgi:acetyltransferase-like isoleucine patch superfamily enzyme